MKILLFIEYDGKNYHGWQEQKEPNTIQGKIQEAIFKFSQEKIKLVVAGRTDTGVHATGQVAHFETLVDRPEDKWLLGLNSFLPEDIRIKHVKFVENDFHARFSALSRSYRYIIFNNKVKPCINRNKVGWYFLNILDENIRLGINDGSLIAKKFEENNKHLNFMYGLGIDTINSFFKLDSKLNNTLSEPIFKILKGNKFLNNYATFLSN